MPIQTSSITRRPRAQLPYLDLGWVALRDHFVQTVGPHAGQGSALGSLLVLADATLAPRSRFPLHGHQEMEIVSIVVSGVLTHHEPETSIALPERSAQLMSAGSGIVHAEGNETDAPVRLLQLWLHPSTSGGPATHRTLGPFALGPKLLRVTPDDLRQDAVVSMAELAAHDRMALTVSPGRVLYAVCLEGEATFNEQPCSDGDGLLLSAGHVEVVASGRMLIVAIELPR